MMEVLLNTQCHGTSRSWANHCLWPTPHKYGRCRDLSNLSPKPVYQLLSARPTAMYKPNNNCANIKLRILSCLALPFSQPRDLNPQIIIQYNSTFALFVGTTPHASNRTADMTGWHASGDGMLSMQQCTLFQVAAEPTTMVAVDPACFFRILRLRWYSWVFNSQPEYILTIS